MSTTCRRSPWQQLLAGSFLTVALGALAACAGDADVARDTTATVAAVDPAATAPPSRKTPSLAAVTGSSQPIHQVTPELARRYLDSLRFDPTYSDTARICPEHAHGQQKCTSPGDSVTVLLTPEVGSHLLTRSDFENGGHLVYRVTLLDRQKALAPLGLGPQDTVAYLWFDAGRQLGNPPSAFRGRFVVQRAGGNFTAAPLEVAMEPYAAPDWPKPTRPRARWGRDHDGQSLARAADSLLAALSIQAIFDEHLTSCFACDEGWCMISEMESGQQTTPPSTTPPAPAR